MDRSVFAQHFLEAAASARDFARPYIEETLPDVMRFCVRLNQSHDANARADFELFPQDSSDPLRLAERAVDAETVIDVLWRDGRVPQWVDLMVVGETGRESVLEVVCCGRFIDDERRLYYADTGIAPFSPKGPYLPIGHVEGVRFSIFNQSTCLSAEALDRARQHSEKVWSLELRGAAFDDRCLASGLDFPRLHILELEGVPVSGPGLAGLASLPRLRHLRARFEGTSELSFADLPMLEALETLTFYSLPARLVRVGRIAEAAPRLKELSIRSVHLTHTDDVLSLRSLETLTLESPRVPSWIGVPSDLRGLHVHWPEATDDDVGQLLARCSASLESVGLRGTPASDAIVDELARFPALGYVDAIDTRISVDALHRLAEGRPRFRCYPRLDAEQ